MVTTAKPLLLPDNEELVEPVEVTYTPHLQGEEEDYRLLSTREEITDQAEIFLPSFALPLSSHRTSSVASK